MDIYGYGVKVTIEHPSQMARLAPEQAPAPDTAVLAKPSDDSIGNVWLVPGDESKTGDFERVPFEEEGADRAAWGYRQDDGGTNIILGEGMETIDGAGSLSEGDAQRKWSVRAEAQGQTFTADWLKGYNLITTPDNRPWPYELHGHDRSMMYVQGPIPTDQASDLEEFLQECQDLISQDTDGGKETLELEYEYDGDKWRQFHQKFEPVSGQTVVVSAQSPAAIADKMKETAGTFADSIGIE